MKYRSRWDKPLLLETVSDMVYILQKKIYDDVKCVV
jgi:hypothetical protein